LITKLYFPRLLLPVAAAGAGLVDFVIAFFLLLGLMAWYGIVPAVTAFTLPLFVLFAVLTALAVGIWLSALNVKYRDVQYAIPFLIQFWLVLTPIAYSASLVPGKWRLIYGLNPMAGVVEGFRWAVLGQHGALSGLVGVSAAAVLVLLVGGLFYFRRMERSFADVI
jgi:homopolymeric O-antigen transport system permease protein